MQSFAESFALKCRYIVFLLYDKLFEIYTKSNDL